jgi:hypothetical protein
VELSRKMKRMNKILALPLLLAMAGPAQTREDDPYVRERLELAQAGVAVSDEAALIRTLRHEKPWLAAYASHFLGKLPKIDPAIRELNAATLSNHEFLARHAMESLMGWGDKQWVSAARSRLPDFKDKGVRLTVAGLLARAGVFDGWNIVESTIMHDAQYRGIALLQVDDFRDMKNLSGQPFDLVNRLDTMRSNSPSKAVRDRLLNKIIVLTRQPVPRPPRE